MVVEMASGEPCQLEAQQQHLRQQIRPPVKYGVDEYADTTPEICHIFSVYQILEPSTIDGASNLLNYQQATNPFGANN